MIGHLEGRVAGVRAGFAIISAGGVGYKVRATRETLAGLRSKEEASLWTHLAVREDALDLYGFADEEALGFFELLLTVSGIGPRSALAILDIAEVPTLRSAIAAGNDSYLTKISGIGKKTAAKIVLELKDKVGNLRGSDDIGLTAGMSSDMDAIEALKSLGYDPDEAREALKKVPKDISDTGAKVKAALKMLS